MFVQFSETFAALLREISQWFTISSKFLLFILRLELTSSSFPFNILFLDFCVCTRGAKWEWNAVEQLCESWDFSSCILRLFLPRKFSCDNFVMQRELIPSEMFYDSVTLTSTWRSDKIKIKQKLSGEWWENICTLKSNRKANKLLIFLGFVKN
jgi:hypothetical protein